MIKIGKVKKNVIPILIIVGLFILGQYLFTVLYYEEPKMEYYANNTYNETLTVVARENFAPFSYVDKNGDLCGYNIELMNLIANNLEMNVKFELVSRDDCFDKIKTGQADVICNVNYTSEFDEICTLTLPAGRHRLVLFGLENFHSVRDLYGKNVGSVVDISHSSNLRTYLGLTNIIDYQTHQEGFEAVNRGEVDYIIGSYASLEYKSNKMGFENIHAVSSTISTDSFAFGVQKGNTELANNINMALMEIENNGAASKVSNKWLGVHIDSTAKADIISKSIPQILLAYSLFLWFLVHFIFLPIHKRSKRDKATKLLDKVTARKTIERKMATDGTMFVIDANNFKEVNDTYGHAVGDSVIKDIADALRVCTRNEDVLGRIGGDEFIAYLPTLIYEKDAYNKAVQFSEEVKRRTSQNPNSVPVTISVGIAVHTKIETYGELFKKADLALYDAKDKEGRIAIHDQTDPSIICK